MNDIDDTHTHTHTHTHRRARLTQEMEALRTGYRELKESPLFQKEDEGTKGLYLGMFKEGADTSHKLTHTHSHTHAES
jgi:hypothetical protein